jgi:Sodium/hydrogen exchanger family
MASVWLQSALWLGLALLASLISIRVAVSVALIEIVVGAAAGNLIGLQITDWVNFLAGFGAILLTFLAGAEIDPRIVRKHFWSSMSIGVVGFAAPYLGVLAYAHFVAGWSWPQAQIARIALSTTSVAVVYAVMIETGFNRTEIGKIILAACFINDLASSSHAMRRGCSKSWPTSERAANEVRLAHSAGAWRHGVGGGKRGGAARLSRRHGARADVSRRTRVASSDADHRLLDPHSILFP